jgi:hypothetical protein
MSKSAIDILRTVIGFLGDTEGVVRNVLRNVDLLDDASPYLELGFVGLRYCHQLLGVMGDPEALDELLNSSPKQLWDIAGDVEAEIALIKAAQLASLKEE